MPVEPLDELPTAARFSRRVQNYARYRPSYPPALLQLMRSEMGLEPTCVIADVGSGTGILSEIFLRHGNAVYGVEPNSEMRRMAEELLRDYPRFISVAGTAEATTLPAASVDFVTAGQSFHWFDHVRARAEFARILRPGGWAVLVWNFRKRTGSPFLAAYDRLLRRFGTDYERVEAESSAEGELHRFFGGEFRAATFANQQTLDYDGLRGRLLSASYIPLEDDPRFAAMIAELQRTFAEHQENGTVRIEYETKVYYGHVQT